MYRFWKWTLETDLIESNKTSSLNKFGFPLDHTEKKKLTLSSALKDKSQDKSFTSTCRFK